MFLILGCTASGKGKLAFELAQRWGGDILSIDSMKVYRGMDIGTAKPDAKRLEAVKHYLVDVVDPWEPFSVGRYLEMADEAIAEIQGKQRPIIAVGGTSMYIRALLEGLFEGPGANHDVREELKGRAEKEGLPVLHRELAEVDPEAAERIHPNDMKRIVRALEVYRETGKPISSFQRQFRSGNYRYPWTIIGLRREREDASRRINARVKRMVEDGLVDEVRGLVDDAHGLSQQAAQAVGYAEIIDHLAGGRDLDDAVEQIKVNSRRLAKSQRTWFRSFSDVNWFDLEADESVEHLVERVERQFPGGRWSRDE